MNAQRFDHKVAVVTAGASGIGEAIARRLVKEGARVVIGDIDAVKGKALVAELGASKALFQRCDVAVQADVDALIRETVQAFGGLDLLFNNAGVGSPVCKTDQIIAEDWHRVIGINLNSVFYGCHAAVPEMRKRGGGAIVNTSSICGLGGDYGLHAYNATKAAVINYTRSLAIDYALENIRVNAFCPGLITTPATDMLAAVGVRDDWVNRVPMRRAGMPDEMAQVATFLASDAASYVTGSIVVADGGLMAHTGQPNMFDYVKAQ